MDIEFQDYKFNLLFFDADNLSSFVIPVTKRASSYDHAVMSALMEGQEIIRVYDGTMSLFMRLVKA
jgi:hypothetical protein